MVIEETVFKMTESANELFSYGEFGSSKDLLQLIDLVCENNEVPFPDEAVALNIALDDKLGYAVLPIRTDS